MTNVYCTAPWNGLTVREDGTVKTCCNGGVSLGNLNDVSIYNIEKSEALAKIQQNLLNGKPDLVNCNTCVRQEQHTGVAALRQHYLKYYPDIIENSVSMQCLDIRWNNSCNLSCMYCSPQFSSVWEDRLRPTTSIKTKNYQDELLDFILEKIDQVKEIMLVGGEPMLMKQNYNLIAKLPNTTKLSILTNLSYDLKNLPCTKFLLARPQSNTIWNISCDNVEQQFEYVRNGATWQQIEENLEFLNSHWKDHVTFNMVYSMFNAFDLVDIVKKLHSLGIKKFHLQTYFGHLAMNVFAMPGELQQKAKQCLQDAMDFHYSNIHPEERDLYPMENADAILSKLNDGLGAASKITLEKFLDRVDWYDQWTSLRFRDVWPNVVDLVHQHLE